MYDKRIVVGLLMLGLLLAAEPVMAQGWDGVAPQAPYSGKCGVNPNRQITSDIKVDSRSCAERQSSTMVKTYAWSLYVEWPSGWDSLWHKARVCAGSGCSTAEKYQTTGLPCPIKYVASSEPVLVEGEHWYQTDEFDATEYEMQESQVTSD